MIAVGQLDTPILIEKPIASTDTNYGGVMNISWIRAEQNIENVWSYLLWKGGAESEQGEQQVGESKVEFYIRYETYKDGIQPNWRIRHELASGNFNYYYIEKIDQIDGRHKMTKLTAVQKDNN